MAGLFCKKPWYGAAIMLLGICAVASDMAYASMGAWRLELVGAAVVRGDTVRLGEIARPVGDIPEDLWRTLSQKPLWSAPDKVGKAMSITGPRLKRAMRTHLPEYYHNCLYPPSMVIQKGGELYDEAALRTIVTKALRPHLGVLGGEALLRDFRLPSFMFVDDAMNTVELQPSDAQAGRLSLRLAEVRPTGEVVRQVTGSVFVDVWLSVPVAAMPLNRGDMLGPEGVTMARKNKAYMRGTPWDGKGGPWRMARTVGREQVIYAEDIEVTPAVARGAQVDLEYRGRRITLKVAAEALADGAVGESIPVRNLQSRRQVYAVVKDSTTVVVH